MTRPVVSEAAEALYAEVSATQPYDEQLGWPFLSFVAGFIHPLSELYDLVRDADAGPGWSPLLDPDRAVARFLSWLAQIVGVSLITGSTVQQQRDTIRDLPPQRRGTENAVRAAVDFTLTGSKVFHFTVQGGADEYTDTLETYEAQTPDPAVTEAAALAQMPAWRLLDYTVRPGWSIGEMETEYTGDTISDLEGDYLTLDDLEHHLPEA